MNCNNFEIHIDCPVITILVACSPAAPEAAPEAAADDPAEEAAAEPAEMRTYYMVSSHQAHPYFADSHLALRYAAEYFQVNIVAAGPLHSRPSYQRTRRI